MDAEATRNRHSTREQKWRCMSPTDDSKKNAKNGNYSGGNTEPAAPEATTVPRISLSAKRYLAISVYRLRALWDGVLKPPVAVRS